MFQGGLRKVDARLREQASRATDDCGVTIGRAAKDDR